MFAKVLIANRGEIAVRIARTCRELAVATVAVYSDADADARHVAATGEAVHLPGTASAETYLAVDRILAAARSTGAEAIHPGYGFLAEDAEFAQAVIDAGLSWVGPPPEAMRLVGDKISARRTAEAAGVPVVPGLTEDISDVEIVREFAGEHGFPIAIKAASGGGGRGLKVARSPEDIVAAFAAARREAEAYFGSAAVYVERYLDAPKHLEVQILSPGPDEALWLGVRDCSLQRRHQKLVEETPPAGFADALGEIGNAAAKVARACGYVNAGTVELLADEDGRYYFLEVNARLQVEHTVTEEVLRLDLVACQLHIAAGEPLGFAQDDLDPRGHAIECRINAEDPARGFIPTPGSLTRYVEPRGSGIRVDSGYAEGDSIPEAYDSLIAKVVVWNKSREEARQSMLAALRDFDIAGISTTIPAHLILLEHPSFIEGTHTTATVETEIDLASLLAADATGDEDVLLVEGRPVRLWHTGMAASATSAVHGAREGRGEVVAPMQGTVLKVLVREGDVVAAGDPVVVLEAMKMEATITAERPGKIAQLRATAGGTVAAGDVLALVE